MNASPELIHNDLIEDLTRRLTRARTNTHALVAGINDNFLCRQFSPLMSPLIWDLGHIAHFEALWLLRNLGSPIAANHEFDRFFDPIQSPRAVRGELELPTRSQTLDYMAEIRARALDGLNRQDFDTELTREGYVYRMIEQHETQHQETMLQALDLHAHTDELALFAPPAANPRSVDDQDRVFVPASAIALGTADRQSAYDNERPQHTTMVRDFVIDRYPVTNRRYLEFIEDDGYRRDALWSESGRRWRDEHRPLAPQGWLRHENEWFIRQFGHHCAFRPQQILQHVSFFEAEAFATWCGGRLPSEAEWEKAAGWDVEQNRMRTHPWGAAPASRAYANIDHLGWGPSEVGAYPDGASAYGVEHMLGDVYEWTSTPFGGYPGFNAFPYPQYSEVFFGTEYRVLRGASWASAASCSRNSFRNWDYPMRRQIFAGIRVAWDAE
ncbi:MAG: ergothioneine biosynthesis protein EgtB [Pseudomonadota bacterium]